MLYDIFMTKREKELKNYDEAIHKFLDDGIITVNDIMHLGEEDIMNKVLRSVHHSAISRGTDGRYYTYVNDESKPDGRRMVRRKSKTDLFKALIIHYGLEHINMTFSELYKEWVDYKRGFVGAPNKKKSLAESTIRRYERDYENYILSSELHNMPISRCTTPLIEKIMLETIKRYDMYESNAKNVMGYIRMAFEYALRSEYSTKNPTALWDRKRILATCRFRPPKGDEERTLTLFEMKSLHQEVKLALEKNPQYIVNYAILLALLTGLRVGELAALKWEDICGDGLVICRAERRLDYSDRKSELVVGSPKNGKTRTIPLTDNMRELFEQIRKLGRQNDEGYIFVREDGRRHTAHDISCAVSRRGASRGISKVSIHRIRRTVSSNLNKYLPRSTVARLMGPTEWVNVMHYDYSTTEFSEETAVMQQESSKVIRFSA